MRRSLNSRQIRITALWAFSEAFLGGLLHGFKVPFSGLILSAFAAVCMSALAMKDHRKGNIIHATVLVLIVKATLSPHTPLTAYFAVSLQGLFGEMIFAAGIPYSLSCYLNALFALMQSAFQKLIILTVLFGTDLWKALDEFIASVLKQFGIHGNDYSIYIILLYLLIYFIAGLLAGRFSSRLKKIEKIDLKLNPEPQDTVVHRKKSKLSSPFFLLMVFIAALLLYDHFNKDLKILPDDRMVHLIIRSFMLVCLWYFILSPLIMQIFKRWLAKKKNAFAEETAAILILLPEMRSIVVQCWNLSSVKKGPARVAAFIRITFTAILSAEK